MRGCIVRLSSEVWKCGWDADTGKEYLKAARFCKLLMYKIYMTIALAIE